MPILPKQELRQLVAIACTDDALRQLLDLLAGVSKHHKVYDAMTMLSGEWQGLDERVRLNLLSFKESSTDRARINHAVLQYLNELPDEVEPPKSKTPAPEALLRQTAQAIAADTTWEYDLFFSFSSKDIESARVFCDRLRGHDLRVFFSADDMRTRGGHNFGDVIDKALQQSRHFLLFCSPNAMESRWVKLEQETFFDSYHLPNAQGRGFYIAEGPDFHGELVPKFYRRLQRILQPEDLLHTLVGNQAPSKTQLPESSNLSESSKKANPADELSWKIACKNNTIAAYQGYLQRWKNGRHTEEASEKIEELGNDQNLWDYLNDHSAGDALEDNLQEYLEAYPSGLYAKEARAQIAALEREREAESARNQQAQAAIEHQQKEATEAEKRRAQAEALASKQREEQETADHHAFYLAQTRADFEAYLKNGYTLHAIAANEKVAVFKKQEEDTARKKREQEEAERKRKEQEEARAQEDAARKKREQEEAERKRKEKEAEEKRKHEADLAALAAEARRAKEAEAKQAEENRKKHEQAERERKAKEADPFHNLMIPIKGGTFDMGDTFGDGGQPAHKVTVPDFHLCKYPVTQAQWKKIMGDTPAHFKGDELPVEQVNWDDAQAFLKKLNAQTGQKYRLPSEAEWEYAAREGGKKVRFGNGKDIADPKEMNFNASEANKKPYSVVGEYRSKTTPVLHFPANALGLHDMSGNAWEWCQDVWHEDYKGAPNDGTAWEQGGDSTRRVVRGGSWIDAPCYCRAAYRYWNDSAARDYYCGFRLAR